MFYCEVSTVTTCINASSSNLTIRGSMEFRTRGSCAVITRVTGDMAFCCSGGEPVNMEVSGFV
jgi:hypothetical protein